MIKAEKCITCSCGNKYTTELDSIIIEENIKDKIVDYISPLCPCGRVLLVVLDGYDSVDIRRVLRKGDYLVDEIAMTDDWKMNDLILDENIRLIIGIGDIKVNRMVKLYSHINKIASVFIATQLDVEMTQAWIDIDSDSLEQYEGDIPKIIIYDASIKLTKEQITYTISQLYYRLMVLFDSLYAYKIYNISGCECLIKETMDIIKDFFSRDFEYNRDLERLNHTVAMVCVNLSYITYRMNSFAEMLYRLLSLKYNSCSLQIISAYTVDAIYRYWLTNNIGDISIPPDRERYYEKLTELFSLNKYTGLNMIKLDNDYSLIDYKVRQSREELLTILISAAPCPNILMGKIRDIYPDKGYHLSKLIDYKTLMHIVALAGELSSEISLVKHIDKSGLLWHYVDKL